MDNFNQLVNILRPFETEELIRSKRNKDKTKKNYKHYCDWCKIEMDLKEEFGDLNLDDTGYHFTANGGIYKCALCGEENKLWY